MGKLLKFAKVKRPDSGHVVHDREAELVVFTGVRYERQQTDDDKHPSSAPRRENGN